MPKGQADRLERDGKIPLPVTRIGTLTKSPDLVLLDAAGDRRPLGEAGWEHRT